MIRGIYQYFENRYPLLSAAITGCPMRNRSRYSVPIHAIGHTAAPGAIKPRRGQVEAEVIGGVFEVSPNLRPVR